MKSSSKYSFVIVLLTISAILLGVVIFYKRDILKSNEKLAGSAQKEQSQLIPSDLNNKLWNEKNILEMIDKNASKEEQDQHFQTAISLAKETTIVEITNCSSKPVVAKVKDKQAILFKNNDSVEHSIIGLGAEFKISANGQKTVIAKADKGFGIYGYRCDKSAFQSGIMYIPE